MSIEEVIEGNKLIAKFCGYKIWTSPNGNISVEDDGFTGQFAHDDTRFAYHQEWSLLVPAYNMALKIVKDLIGTQMNDLTLNEFHTVKMAMWGGFAADKESHQIYIDKPYKALVNFIKWHNTIK